jgi:phage host-nuclease inhibitor protein Gam
MKNQVESLVSHQRTCEIELNERKQENIKLNCEEPEEIAEINQAFSAKIKEICEEIESAYAEVENLSLILKSNEEQLLKETELVENSEKTYNLLLLKLKEKENCKK